MNIIISFTQASYLIVSFWTFIHPKSKEANKYDLLRFSKTLANEKVTSCHRKKSVGFIKYD